MSDLSPGIGNDPQMTEADWFKLWEEGAASLDAAEPLEPWSDELPPIVAKPAKDERDGVLPHFWFNEAEPSLDANDFVEGLLTSSAMSVVYGPSNCGKTFFVLDLALHVALNRSYRGREVDGGAVVYLALEGGNGVKNRIAAFRKHHGLDKTRVPIAVMPKPVNLLSSKADVEAVIRFIKYVEEVTGKPVVMVVIDTLSRAMAGGNENGPEDMTAIVGNCDAIKAATGAHVCIVHHSGKDEAKGGRGHSSLRAATDTEIEIRREPDSKVSTVKTTKQRDLEAAAAFSFRLETVELGMNRRGKPVTSCVVLPADEQQSKLAATAKPIKLGHHATNALVAIRKAYRPEGSNPTRADFERPFSITDMNKLLASIGIEKARASDARSQLQAKNLIRVVDCMVTITDMGWNVSL